MLTTTLDGLWVLQVLTGIEVLATELGLRPHLPSAESAAMALAHPAAADLQTAGVIDALGSLDPAVHEWLTVLSRRDTALLFYVQTPTAGAEPERIVLARLSKWWVCLERHGSRVRLSGAGIAASEQRAGELISAQVERLCGRLAPAPVKPVTLDSSRLIDAVRTGIDLRRHLSHDNVDPDQMSILTLAADPVRSAQASVVAVQAGVADGPARTHISAEAVTIIDTPRGRLLSEHVVRQGKSWMIVSPGSSNNIASAVMSMLRGLPAQQDWYSYRKVV